MPELPEVETIVRGLKKEVPGRAFIDVWTDFQRIIKKPKNFKDFKKEIKGKKILKIRRRGKNIIFDLSDNKSLLIHQKLTGHLLYGTWKIKHGIWKPTKKGPLEEKVNAHIHLLFNLDNGKMLALSDLRKFAKAELWNNEELKKKLSSLGPEPLGKNLTYEKFKEVLSKKKKSKIKQVLIDQEVIAGIGNIYSDEILWKAKIHPAKEVSKLKKIEFKKIYQAMRKILKKAIGLGGESISDFRKISGEKGHFDKERRVYRREEKKCIRCGAIIKRLKIGGRSAYFCSNCQKT